MKIFLSEQVREADAYTIKHEPISSINLMERAAGKCFDYINGNFNNTVYHIFVGPGNNGGDGLVIARMLAEENKTVFVYILNISPNFSADFSENLVRLRALNEAKISEIKDLYKFPELNENEIVIDAIFGSGLSRPIQGFVADVIHKINESKNIVLSIDIPSGLFGEDNSENILNNIVKADYTLTFQFPKLAFLLPDNSKFVGEFKLFDIGVHKNYIKQTKAQYFYTQQSDIKIKKRKKFSHKGTFGHAFLYSGSYGKTGALILSAKSCLRTGVGLLSAFVPQTSYNILQTSVPEAMCFTFNDINSSFQTPDLSPYNAIGIGPGIGKERLSLAVLTDIIQKNKNKVPMVIDADGLNLLSENKYLLKELPENSILTPHPGEFKRLVKDYKNDTEKLDKLKKLSGKFKLLVVLKGANTVVAVPDGRLYFNTTGNPGMATAGSGDVLTGIILSLLAQNYNPLQAAVFGSFIHGLAGDLAAEIIGQNSLIASDIIDYLPQAFNKLN